MGTGGESTADDLCDGFSPCDGYGGYFHQNIAAPGFCFLPPMVDNHTSDPACAGALLHGLGGFFELAWCEVSYADVVFDANGFPTAAPEIVQCSSARVPFTEGGGFYSASVRFRKPDEGKIFRLYVVHDDQHFAHRDVIVHPNETRPADDYLHAIGTGTEPVKVVITESFTCAFFDTQEGGTDNAASCLIAGETSFSFASDANGLQFNTTFNFPDGNEPFFADVEVSECLSLGFHSDGSDGATGNALVDVPLVGCKVSLSSEDLQALAVPGQITLDLFQTDPFAAPVRPNVLQYDEFGIAALPPSEAPLPDWLGTATGDGLGYRMLDWGRERLRDLAAFFGPEPLYAWPGSGWDFTRLSEFQIAWMPVMEHDQTRHSDGTACASGIESCLDVGTYSGVTPVLAGVHVTAPSTEDADPTALDVEGARLHFLPEDGSGSVDCPVPAIPNETCVPANTADGSTTPPSMWDHPVVITGANGTGTIAWTLAGGNNRLHVVACGVARPGGNEPNPPEEPEADGVWGTLTPESCVARDPNAAGFDDGPADGLSPFEPARDGAGGEFGYETAIYGLPLTFEARTCPEIDIDGDKDPGEWDCADVEGFIVPLKGPNATSDNAWLYTYYDDEALYIGVEVDNDELGNKMYINLLDGPGFAPQADDDVLVLDFGNPDANKDWFYTAACVGNNASSLCGAPDTQLDHVDFRVEAAASLTGADGHVFYEFKRPFRADVGNGQTADEDLDALPGQVAPHQVGVRATITQGQGGGKGGFVIPVDGTYYVITLE
jgi:hypothetical protein